MVFDSRQLATFILFGCFLLLGLAKRQGRSGLAKVVRSFWQVKVAGPLLFYVTWLAGVHWLAAAFSIWNGRLLGESIFWTIVAGFVPLFRMTNAREHRHPFRSLLRDLVKITVFFGFFFNLKPLDLVGELILQGTLTFLLGLQVVAERNRSQQVSRMCKSLVALAALGLAVYTVVWLVRDGHAVDWAHEVRKFFLPIWLTVGAFPYIYVFALWDRYSLMFGLLMLRRDHDQPARRSRLGLVLGLRGRLNDIHDFPRYAYLANGTQSIGDGWRAVRTFREKRAASVAKKQADAEDLVRNTGVVGVDEHGRTLDRREFKETKSALLYLATCQSGWHNRGGYQADLLDKLGSSFARHGLSAEHSISMTVSADGQRWYAYRRTPSGRVLGIGALEESHDQWFYEGDDPPTNYPEPGGAWGRAAHDRGVDWHRST
ncbi:hypothetical protein SAMN04487818_11595 [Actinokineospora terrae]|uniref:Uncharacterized protein n=1 Tax=Actinokineospora terrae TaxID=155974 RepID=A0A1H9XH09_9PSEU|nr:hypothetical protein SAMN04487818_11595 [Actinokineospora terrae]